jgi:hypothetical protein
MTPGSLPAPQALSARGWPAPAAPWPAPGDRLDSLVGNVLDSIVEGVGLVLHDAGRPLGGGGHVVASPAGIDVVHVRVVYGRVRVGFSGLHGRGRTLLLDDTDVTAAISELDDVVDTVRQALDGAQVDAAVRGWLCLGGADWNSEPAGIRLGGYSIVPPAALPELIDVDGPHWAVRSLAVLVGKALACEPEWEQLARSWATPAPGRQRPVTRSRWPRPRQVA